MSALLTAALARAEAFLLEPEEPPPPPAAARGPLPVVGVFGLAGGCGSTVVARALAAEMGTRGDGAAAITFAGTAGGIPLATAAAARLARTLAEVPHASTRAAGRLCLVGGADPRELADAARHHAPLVLDTGSAALGGAGASAADVVVLVAGPRTEPALAAAAKDCLTRVSASPLVVVNRLRAGAGWDGAADVCVPESRTGARLALAGREVRGGLGAAIAELADRCEERAS